MKGYGRKCQSNLSGQFALTGVRQPDVAGGASGMRVPPR